jgi:hypothetical protein
MAYSTNPCLVVARKTALLMLLDEQFQLLLSLGSVALTALLSGVGIRNGASLMSTSHKNTADAPIAELSFVLPITNGVLSQKVLDLIPVRTACQTV